VVHVTDWSQLFATQSKKVVAVFAVLLTFLVGYLDYESGPSVSMSAYYLLPLALATWYVGSRFAIAMIILGIGNWIPANLFNGDPNFVRPLIVVWNATVQLISDVIVVSTVARLRDLHAGLEARVRERAAALTLEISERERVQEELLRVSESEQRRIGRDLHDGLCQHLAATALSCQLLREELEEQGLPEAARAGKLVEQIENSVRLSKQSARGLEPVAMDAEGLMLALEEVAATTTDLFRISCTFECESPVLIRDAGVAENLFRIAQEAIRNAASHSHARHILVSLETTEEGLELRIEDDGIGIDADKISPGGMGLRIMPLRAQLIGASFSMGSRLGGGTVICCALPQMAQNRKRIHEPSRV
jgi:signal transduction histidine kinase